MPPTIYFIKHELFVKIGFSDNFEKRLKSYNSQGNEINLIATIEVENKDVDDLLKASLHELNYHAKQLNSSSTELYNLTRKQTNALIEHLRKNKKISKKDLILLLQTPETFPIRYAIREFLKQYGIRYNHFEYQRETTIDHVENIKNYIMNNYDKHYFQLSTIYAVKSEEKKYTILDGAHRIEAMKKIPYDHPSLDTEIIIEQNEALHTTKELIHAFRCRNSCRPMAGIHLKDNYVENVHNDLMNKLISRYQVPNINTSINEHYHVTTTLSRARLHKYINLEYIQALIDSSDIISLQTEGYLMGLDKDEIFRFLDKINTQIVLQAKKIYGENMFDDRYKNFDEEKHILFINFIKIIASSHKYSINSFLKTWYGIWEAEATRRAMLKAWIKKNKHMYLTNLNVYPFVFGIIPRGNKIHKINQNLEDYLSKNTEKHEVLERKKDDPIDNDQDEFTDLTEHKED